MTGNAHRYRQEALMANFQWRKIRARCPYYIASWDKGIRCEGIEEGQSAIRLSFRREAGAADWFDRFCARNYRQCPIYQLHEEAEAAGNGRQIAGTTPRGGGSH